MQKVKGFYCSFVKLSSKCRLVQNLCVCVYIYIFYTYQNMKYGVISFLMLVFSELNIAKQLTSTMNL